MANENKTHWNYINLYDSSIVNENVNVNVNVKKEETKKKKEETKRSFLIEMPETSQFAGKVFWVNISYMGEDNKIRGAMYIAVPDDYDFEVFKSVYDKDARKWVKTDITHLTVSEMLSEWKTVSDEITEKRNSLKKEFKFDHDKFKEAKKKFIEEKSKRKKVEYDKDDIRAVQPFEVDKTYTSTVADDDDNDGDDDDLDFDG